MITGYFFASSKTQPFNTRWLCCARASHDLLLNSIDPAFDSRGSLTPAAWDGEIRILYGSLGRLAPQDLRAAVALPGLRGGQRSGSVDTETVVTGAPAQRDLRLGAARLQGR